MPVSAPKTEIKTDYSQPQSNYDRVQQVAAKQTPAQLKQPDNETEKRYIINPVNQTVAQVDKENTVSSGVLQKALSAVGNYLYDRYKNKGGQLSDYEKQVMYNQGGVKGEDAGDSRAGHVVAASALNTVGGLATAVEGLAQFSNSDNYNRRMMYNQGAGAARGAVQDIQHRKETKLNTDTFGTRTLAKAREETEEALAGLDPVEQFMTQTMISVLQNAYLMPVGMLAPVPASMAAGAVGVTLSDAMIKAIPALVSTTLLSTSAAGNTMYDETTEGKNLQQAFTRGVIDGSIEFATEKIGVDNWLEMLAGKGGSVLKKLLIQSGSEAGEEALSYIAGYLVDVAEKEPDAAFSAQELMLSALGGAVSGAILGGGAAFAGSDVNINSNVDTQTAEQAQGQTDAQAGMQVQPRIDEQIRRRAVQNIPTVQRLAENGIAPQSDVDALTDTIVGENGESRRQVTQVAAAENRKVDIMRQLAESGIADRQDLAKVQQAARERVQQAAVQQAEQANKTRQTMQAVEEFAAGKGLKVEYFSDGDRRAPEGYISGDTVYINMASDAPIVGVAVHEVGHRLKGGNIKRWNRYARSVSRLMSTNRELAGYAAQVRDSYTDPDSVRYSSVLDENGNIDRAKVDEEVMLKVTQEILKRTADGDTDFLRQIAADRSLIDRLLDFIRGIKNSITIKLTGSEMAMLDEAERNLVNLMRKSTEHSDLSVERFSVGRITDRYGNYTDNGIILDDISLEELSVEQRQEFIKNFVKNTLRGRQFIVTNPAGETEILEIADKKREYKKDTSKNAQKAINKLALFKNKSYIRNLAILHIDEIVDNSSYSGKSSRNTHGDFDRNGWNYRLAYLQDKNGRIYQAILNIAKTADGKNIIYDVGLQRTIKIAEAVLNPVMRPAVHSASADYNISNSDGVVNQSAQTRQKNTTKDNKRNTKHSLHIDSDGKKLTDEQAAYFADSQVRDDNGALMKVYHQTGADFTRFDTGRPGAGQYDAEMPTGIFTKPTADDIGLGGQKQMELYANITNPLRFNNRAEAVRYWERNIEGYRQARRRIENLDNEYQEKYDAADLLEDEEYKSIRQQLMNKEITREEFRARLENTETKRILNEWTQKSNELRRQAKALIDEYISKSGYDGVIVENDTGSFGRRVKSIIALNSNQLKNTDNLTPTADDDIRYSLDIRQRILQQTAKADNIKNRAVSDFTRQVRDIFGIDSSVSADIKTAVQDMATEVLDNGYVSPAAANRLFDKAVRLGSEIDDNYRQYEELRKRINRTGIEPVGGAEYRDFLARYRGKVKFKRGGIPLDTFYRELQEMYPEYFPDINNIYDRMEQIGRVYDDISNKFVSLEDYYGEAFRDFKEMSRAEFMERLDRFTARVNSAYRYNEALGQQQRRRQFANKAAAAGVDYEKAMQSFDSVTELDNQIGRLKKQYAFTDSEIKLVEYMVGRQGRALQSRKDMVRTFPYNGEHILKLYELSKAKREIMRPLNYTYARQKDDARAKTIKFMRSMRLAKEKQSFRGLRYTTRSFERTVDRLIKDQKQNEAFKDEYVRPVHKAATAAQRMKNEYRDRVRRLNLDQKKKYNVKFENRQGKPVQGKLSEAGLVQAYGEGLINDSYLEQIGADGAKIKAAAGELKKIYRELYRRINETNIRNGYRPMEHRRDYFPHFQEEDGLIDKIRAKLGMGPQEELPIDIAGLTSQFTPGRKWNRFALQRTTDTTAYDALRGFDMYIETAADVIHTTDIIQKLRMLESSIRYMYSDRGVKAQLDEIDNNTNLSPNEKLEMKNKVYADLDKNNSGRGLTGFVQWLHGYTNGLAGKKSDADRDVEFKLGRGIYTFSKNFEGRVAANMIGGNISSALTNFIPITQMTAEVKGKYILAAMYDTMKSLHTNDGFDRQSDFLVRRFGSERLYETLWDKMVKIPVAGPALDMVYNLMELVDEFSSNVVTRGMYIQKINEGMESRSAMQYADEFAARLMADRSKGALPTIYNEQNPIKKLFTMFQVEQANQFQYLFGDLPRIAGASGKPLRYLLFMLFKVSLWAYLFNRVYEKIAGRKPAFSPLDIIFDAAGRFTGKTVNNPVDIIMGEGLIEERTKMKPSAAIIETAKDVAEQVPFIGGFLGGGRVPVSSAGVDLSNLAKLSDEDVAPEKKRQILFDELSNPLAYLALPGGGGQIRKIWQGGQLIADDGVMYATDKYGNKTVKFAVDINPLTRAQALVFGQWASGPAQEYINSFKGLGKTQTGVFEEMKKEGRSNSRAFTFAQTITKSEEEGGADADGNGYLKSEEVQSYLDKQTNLSQSAKANIFRLLMPDVKYNPYEK